MAAIPALPEAASTPALAVLFASGGEEREEASAAEAEGDTSGGTDASWAKAKTGAYMKPWKGTGCWMREEEEGLITGWVEERAETGRVVRSCGVIRGGGGRGG